MSYNASTKDDIMAERSRTLNSGIGIRGGNCAVLMLRNIGTRRREASGAWMLLLRLETVQDGR